jgi:redox-sensitive bicupin YhaK (pirin superfamily)
MITLRPSNERGHANFGWLDTYHTFSFGNYLDPEHMGFRSLRVINEDVVQPGQGFGTHPHRDMEIVTYVLEGALEHKDSMGNGSVIRPGDVQRMTAGTGVTHSEFNALKTEPVHLLQIWILPERNGLTPDYEQRAFDLDARRGQRVLIAARDGRDGAVTVHQNVDLFAAKLDPAQKLARDLKSGRHAWVQVARGEISLSGIPMKAGDGAAASKEKRLEISAADSAEILLFDLA